MGKIIIFDQHVEDVLQTLSKKDTFETGLLIGQSTTQKDIVIHVCTTPAQEVCRPAAKSVSPEKEQKKGKQTQKKQKPENKLDENWICQHAKQVARMLPGGLAVLGVFIIANQEELNDLQPTLRQVLFSVYKILLGNEKYSVETESKEKILLQICAITQKPVCRTFDISDYKSVARPAEWKCHSGVLLWHRLDTLLNLDFQILVDNDRSTQSLLRQMKTGLIPFFDSVHQMIALINGNLRNEDELLYPSVEGKKGKRSSTKPTTQQSFKVDLLLPLKLNNNGLCDPKIRSCCAAMDVTGMIQCRGYVHSKGTVKEAIQFLKQDIIRSITSRCEIQCEDLLLIDEEQQDPSIVHELPRRVFAPLPQSDLSVCDYLFHGDSAIDSLDAFQELLNLKLTEDDVEVTVEKTPDTRQLFKPQVNEIATTESKQSSSILSTIMPYVSAIMAVLAIGISYFAFRES